MKEEQAAAALARAEAEASGEIKLIECPRCGRKVLASEYSLHMTSHSTELVDGFLFLGGRRNVEND